MRGGSGRIGAVRLMPCRPERGRRSWAICANWRTVKLSRRARSMTRSRPLLLALHSGISGSGPSRSKSEASRPSAIEQGDAAVGVHEGVEQCPLVARLLRGPANDKAAGQDLDVVRRTPSRRGGLQPFIEATPSRLLLPQQIISKIARVGCSLRRPARDRRIGLAKRPHPYSACFRSRSGITKFPHRKSLTRSSC